jgi:cell filamentation protein
MPRKQYESYRYDDPNFEYTCPNSSTLRNKLEIHDQTLALEKEYQLSAERVLELSVKPVAVRSMKDARAIHRFMFQDMYAWAGEYRKVNISKSGKAFMARATCMQYNSSSSCVIKTPEKSGVFFFIRA